MNIKDKDTLHECTSCQMCAAVCPKDAISIDLNEDGFYRPVLDTEKCVDCGICRSICYKYDSQIGDFCQEKLSATMLYGAFANDREVISNTTSGGVADLLARQLINKGYKCVGVVYDSESDTAVHRVASSVEETIGFRGSKYIQSYTFSAFKKIVKECKTEKYAVFGTPCQVYAIDRFLNKRKVRNDHILIDLYCHGCPSMNIWKKYIKNVKMKISKDVVDGVNFRSKIKGWGNFYVEVEVDGKPVFYSDNRNNEFFDLFFSDQVLNEACNDCLLRSTLAYTDIRLGDFWGKQYVMNNRGVSAVSIVTEKAKELFDDISNHLTFKIERYENFLPWQSWGKVYKPNKELRIKLLEQLRTENVTLRESIDTIYQYQGKVEKLIKYGKFIVHEMPIQVEKCIRWIFYKLLNN